MTEEVIHPLVALREERNLTQIQLAEAIRLGSRTIWAAEHNKPISADSRRRLCRFFKKSARELGLIAAESKARERKRQKRSNQSVSVPQPIVASLSQEQSQITEVISTSSLTKLLQTGLVSVFIQDISLEAASVDCTIWFNEKLVQLLAEIDLWKGRALFCEQLQTILERDLNMFDMMKPFYHPDEYLLSRRQALIVLASLPLGMLIDVQQRLKAPFPQEDLLPVCAASLTACWHLIQGREFAALERALSRYAVFLVTWAQQPSVYQKAAAYLASQACLLLGLVATHQLRSPKNLQRRLAYCKQAVEHAKTSGDPTLLVMALIHFGYTLYYLEQLENMLQAYQEAAQYSNEVLPLVRSKLFAGLAHAYAQNGQNQEALRSIQKARAIFPGDSSIVPSFVLADCGLFSLIMDEGRTHLVLGQNENNATSAAFYYKQSEKALAQIEELSATIVIPERFRIEIVNQQALLSVKVGNLENFRKYLAEGAHGAQMLQSEKRRQEVIANWKEARNMWPHESQIRELADLFL